MKFEYDKQHKNVLIYEMPASESMGKILLSVSLRLSCIMGFEEKFGSNDWLSERLSRELNVISETASEAAVRIVREIASLSREAGYPVMLCGPESGLLTAYILGASTVRPEQYGCGDIPLYFFSEQSRRSLPPSFEISAAEPVREKIIPHLEKKFGGTAVEKTGAVWKGRITVSSFRALDMIGKLASMTGVPFDSIKLDTQDLAAAVRDDIIKEEFDSDDFLENPHPGPVVYYAFARCSANVKKDDVLLRRVGYYVFRDNVFAALVKIGFDERDACRLSRLWSRGEKREAVIGLLRERGAPDQLIEAFRHLTNLWTRTACLSRTNIMQILKFYEINYPKEYREAAGN